jgi:hypothetical protein
MIPDKDFSIMEFNPLIKGKVLEKYPKLKGMLGEAEDKVVRYILLMYDQNSPLRHHYPDLTKRKQFAADLAGFDLDKDDVIGLYEFKVNNDEGFEPHEELIRLTMKYLKYQNNMVWQMIVSNEQAFFEYNKRVMMPVDGSRDKDILQAVEIKTKIMQSMDDIYQRLQKYNRDLTGGDDMLEEVLTKKKRLRPEEIANVRPGR